MEVQWSMSTILHILANRLNKVGWQLLLNYMGTPLTPYSLECSGRAIYMDPCPYPSLIRDFNMHKTCHPKTKSRLSSCCRRKHANRCSNDSLGTLKCPTNMTITASHGLALNQAHSLYCHEDIVQQLVVVARHALRGVSLLWLFPTPHKFLVS